MAEETCRHGIPVTDRDAANCAFYENPDHLTPAGPGRPTGLIEGSGRLGGSKALDQMMSVRFDVPTLRALRLFTDETGRSFSDVIRAAVWDYIERSRSGRPHPRDVCPVCGAWFCDLDCTDP